MADLTQQQHAIVTSDAPVVKVIAGAGTGKSFTLREVAKANSAARILLICFNKSVQLNAEASFPKNTTCVTGHGLAYRHFGAQYGRAGKLGDIKPFMVARAMPSVHMTTAGHVINALMKFIVSADDELTLEHTSKTHALSAREDILRLAKDLWEMAKDVSDPRVKMPHDGYLKLFQLSRPTLPYDIIMLDEAQDTNPVLHALVEQMAAKRKIYVGDPRQSIYSYRGAVDALGLVQADATFPLSESFRFGQGVAHVANLVLSAYTEHPYPLTGRGPHPTAFSFKLSEPHTILSRTNAMLFNHAVSLLDAGRRFHLVGGVDAYNFASIMDAYNLQSGLREQIKDPNIRQFASYTEMVDYAEELEDRDLLALIKIVAEYEDRSIPDLIEQIRASAIKDDALQGDEIILTTGHRAKGLEWNNVQLSDDFADMAGRKNRKTKEIDPPNPEEVNLLHVAITRAMRAIRLPASFMRWLSDAHPDDYRTICINAKHGVEAASFDKKTPPVRAATPVATRAPVTPPAPVIAVERKAPAEPVMKEELLAAKPAKTVTIFVQANFTQADFLSTMGVSLLSYDTHENGFVAQASEEVLNTVKDFFTVLPRTTPSPKADAARTQRAANPDCSC